MTPAARVATAITLLDQIRAGQPAEQALTGWARASRFAGAKDRAAIRDLVFDALRARRSLGDGDGRALMLRMLRRDGQDIAQYFNGLRHGPAAMDADEQAALDQPLALSEAASCDLPDWLWPLWQAALGDQARAAAEVLQGRADVFLRVNRRRTDPEAAIAALAQDGVTAVAHGTVAGCLRVQDGARRLRMAEAYLGGLVELQDAASQRAVALMPAVPRLLDYCAGGGGKALAFADRGAAVFAHDINPARLRDLPQRAARAGVAITLVETAALAGQAPFDLVFCDAPCSGSGTWRRTPDAKWRLSPERLASLVALQDSVISAGAALVRPGGYLAYATCSVLTVENAAVVARFMAKTPGWRVILQDLAVPSADGDGFFLCLLQHEYT